MRRRAAWLVAALLVALAALWWWRYAPADPAGAMAPAARGSAAALDHHASVADEPRASLAGRVTRAQDGAPVPGAIVSLTCIARSAVACATTALVTDRDGAWIAREVAPGDYLIAATALGYEPAVRGRLAVAPADALTGVDLALGAGGVTLRGRATDIGGGPVAGVQIAAQDGLVHTATADLVTTTAADGSYALTVREGTYTLIASHEDYAREHRDVDAIGRPAPVDFVLVPGGVIRGQVIARETQLPVPSARIRRDDEWTPIVADDHGNFVWTQLPAGALDVTAVAPGYASSAPTTIGLGIGERVEGVRLIVDRAFSVRGRVVAAGRPSEGVPGVSPFAYSSAPDLFGEPLEPSDRDGAFEIIGMRPGAYKIVAFSDEHLTTYGKPFALVDRDLDGVVVEIDRGTTLSGRVEPPGRARITMTAAGGWRAGGAVSANAMRIDVETDAGGAFVLRAVPAGRLSLVATTTTGASGTLPVTVTGAAQTGLVVELAPRASISGTVIDSAGAPVPHAHVDVAVVITNGVDLRESSSVRTVSGADGSYRVVGLAAGRAHVRVSDDLDAETRDYDAAAAHPPVEVDLAEGAERTNVTLTIATRTASIHGIVTASNGRPVADARVSASRVVSTRGGDTTTGAPAAATVLTGADGRFAIAPLREGSYTLTATSPRGDARGMQAGVHTGAAAAIALAPLGTLTVIASIAGAPLTTYELECDGTDTLRHHVTAPDGRVVVPHLEPGPYVCSAIAAAGETTSAVEVPAGAVDLPLAIAGWATVTGTAVDVLTGRPVAGLTVAIRGRQFELDLDADGPHTPTTDAAGHFVALHAPVGAADLSLTDPGTWETLAEVDYTAAAGATIDLGTVRVVPARTGAVGQLGIEVSFGDAHRLTVDSVAAGGPGEHAGLRVGDEIIAIDGHTAADLANLDRVILANVAAGQRVELGLARGVTVTVIAVPVD